MNITMHPHAFKLRDAVIATVVAAIGLSITVVFLSRLRANSWRQYDATCTRGVEQAMTVWANQNENQLPLPSRIDISDATILAPARSKDTTANILSMLLFAGHVSNEILVSQAEVNPRIRVFERYQFDDPIGAANPSNALWDPAFSVDFTSPQGGGLSYGLIPPLPNRLSTWTVSSKPLRAIVGNRGPEITRVEYQPPDPTPTCTFGQTRSNSFRIHGPSRSWEGNIAYCDGSVQYERSIANLMVRNITINGHRVHDVLFTDEDEPTHTNSFLGIFIRAGEDPADFQAIWD